jgi:hypothetical protein
MIAVAIALQMVARGEDLVGAFSGDTLRTSRLTSNVDDGV